MPYACQQCGETFDTKQGLGGHSLWNHSCGKHAIQASVMVSSSQIADRPRPCDTCILNASDVEKAMITVLIRSGLSIDKAMKTVAEIRPFLRPLAPPPP
jgi:hypothetical protein